jgi:hypothetical protein
MENYKQFYFNLWRKKIEQKKMFSEYDKWCKIYDSKIVENVL